MRAITVAAAALNQTPMAWDSNQSAIEEAIRKARDLGCTILCLPELCISGYGCEDAFHSPGVHVMALERLKSIASSSGGILVTLGLPLAVQGSVFNVVAVVVDGELVGLVPKQHLAGDGVHYEPRWFKPWPKGSVTTTTVHGQEVPFGDLLFEVNDITIGFEICEDAWVANRPGRDLYSQGVDVILNPSASHFAFGKHQVRKRIVLEGSRSFGVAYVYANLLGCEAGRTIYDGDTLIASAGEMLAAGMRFSFRDVEIVSATVDVDKNRVSRYRSASFESALKPSGRRVVVRGFSFNPSQKTSFLSSYADWELSRDLKHEEFWRAVSLGLFDYLRKSRNHGFVISLSGGVDSSATACLVMLMVELGCEQIGIEGFKEKLRYLDVVQSARSAREILRALLVCVYQATRQSSIVTRKAAKEVAEKIGALFYEWDISSIVDAYEDLVAGSTGVPFTWEEHDLVKQNIQARVRSPSIWLLANMRRALLLSTANRSEAAVGYSTMDGDSSGGLSPLGGIDKAYLREWLQWLEAVGPHSPSVTVSALHLVNQQEPTAELRPLTDNQTDEQDLMPYRVLDVIERYAIRDKNTPKEVLLRIELDFKGEYSRFTLISWVKRFFTLWAQNQWKRERYAPSFHLDDESVDPKTWCRFPILSGGFVSELSVLQSKD
jgi:NAD+ synthase (glutamine-hydrolysing)